MTRSLTIPAALRRLSGLVLLVAAAPAGAITSSSTSVTVGDAPVSVAARGAGSDVFVANRLSNTISVVDARSQEVVRTIDRGGGLNADLAVDPVRDRLYDLDETRDRLIVRRAGNGLTLRTIDLPAEERPVAVAVEPTENRVFVLSGRPGGSVLRRIDPAAASPLGASRALGLGARDVAVSDAADRVFVSMGGEDRVRAHASTGLAQVASIAVGDDPRGMAVLGDGTANPRLVVANRGSDTVSVFRPDAAIAGQTITVGDRPVAVGADDLAERAWVSNNGSGDLTVIERRDGELRRVETRPAGTTPAEVAVDPASHRAVVARPPQDRVRIVRRYHPRAHGFAFVNAFSTPIQVNVPGLPPTNVGAIPYGLCGGMSFSSLDTFLAGVTRPPGTVTPSSGPVFDEVFERLLDSLTRGTPPMGLRYPALQLLPDDDIPNPFGGIAVEGLKRITREEADAIRPTLDTGRPVPLGLVFGGATDNPFANHQVLAIGHFSVDGERVVEVYDPNFPAGTDDDGITYLWSRQRRQTSDRAGQNQVKTFRALFSVDEAYERETPPWA